MVALALLGVAVAVGAYPVARRITRRLEKLQSGVERLGAGDLSTRIELDGNDEVAALAESFNSSADRIQQLVDSQRRILSHASHELRTPLARLQIAVELLAENSPRTDLREEVRANIEELDALIEDLLLAARIQSGIKTRPEEVALGELIRHETRGAGASLRLDELDILGFPRELRRLVRNLVENAKRHGGAGPGSPLEIELSSRPAGGARLRVMDRGPGVAEGMREAIFEPFRQGPETPDGEPGNVGLGLPLVREIARHHGGDARCLPREGGGCIFEIDLAVEPPSA